uniref:Uncharacterized protein n=1 Tax=Anguilla anguilla TaxID=7936 RepID=A0A0E9PQC1_ANGAN
MMYNRVVEVCSRRQSSVSCWGMLTFSLIYFNRICEFKFIS